ncbi:hypothetical protein T01_16300 [Trichinella spiralis]|uniref:Uncharacterized protein n=1 Tax=Trichinella spiralis TaxID=6334 RepID=A0A0V0YZA1_TRISP|nr:hypothetical protein T01_16300 [Trichinella spiralis]
MHYLYGKRQVSGKQTKTICGICGQSSGIAIEGHKGRPDAGRRFSQYSRLDFALTQGLKCVASALPQRPCF